MFFGGGVGSDLVITWCLGEESRGSYLCVLRSQFGAYAILYVAT